MGSVVGYTAYTWLLSNAPLGLVSTYAYVNPVVAIILGVLFRNETVSVRVGIEAAYRGLGRGARRAQGAAGGDDARGGRPLSIRHAAGGATARRSRRPGPAREATRVRSRP